MIVLKIILLVIGAIILAFTLFCLAFCKKNPHFKEEVKYQLLNKINKDSKMSEKEKDEKIQIAEQHFDRLFTRTIVINILISIGLILLGALL